jgi:hypothetical protein
MINEAVFWSDGWYHEEMFERNKEAVAIVRWARDVLSICTELASGYGHEEIRNKIDLVIDKLAKIT